MAHYAHRIFAEKVHVNEECEYGVTKPKSIAVKTTLILKPKKKRLSTFTCTPLSIFESLRNTDWLHISCLCDNIPLES